jgi:hypothetical protein
MKTIRGLVDARHLKLLDGTWLHNVPRPCCSIYARARVGWNR